MNDVSEGTLPLGVNRDFGKHIRVQIYQLPLPKSHPVSVAAERPVEDGCCASTRCKSEL